MPRFKSTIVILFLAVTFAGDAFGQHQTLVGDRGDLNHLKLVGLKSFAVTNVRQGLAADPETILASHPLASQELLPGVINQRVLKGFQKAGFADAKVLTKIDPDGTGLLVQVDEGVRFKAGRLRIENTKTMDVIDLTQRLTRSFPPIEAVLPKFHQNSDGDVAEWQDKDGKSVELSEPVWVSGEWARLDEYARLHLREQVLLALKDLGYRDAKFDIRLEPDIQGRTMDLVISMIDEGKIAKIEEIIVRGNIINSTPAILEFLNLNAGTLLTRQRETKIQYDLWRSGRFESSTISLLPPFGSRGHSLVLEVQETPGVTSISEPLSKVETACLKMGRWLSKTNNWTGDLVMQGLFNDRKVSAVFSPNQGWLVSSKSNSNPNDADFACALSSHEFGIYPGDLPCHFQSPPPEKGMELSIQIKSSPGERMLSIGFLTTSRNKSKIGDECPFNINFRIEPALCLKMANLESVKKSWQGDILTIELDSAVIRIESQSGRLLSIKLGSGASAPEITFVEGRFIAELEELHQQRKQSENLCDADQPIQSLLDFLSRGGVYEIWSSWALGLYPDLKRSDVELIRLGAQVFALGKLEPFQQNFLQAEQTEISNERFSIPLSPETANMSWVKRIGFVLISVANSGYPRESWMWSIFHEAGFLMSGHSEYTGLQIQNLLQSDEFGPVANMLAAMLCESIHPKSARDFAERGISQAANGFALDYSPFLDRSKPVGETFFRVCESLMEANENQLLEIQQRIPDQWSELFAVFAGNLRTKQEQALEARIVSALDAVWDAGLSETVGQTLRGVVSRNDFEMAKKRSNSIQR